MSKLYEEKVLDLNKKVLHLFASEGFDFIFKGGTSLHLMYEDMNRISQDIDIAVNKETADAQIPLMISCLSKRGFKVTNTLSHEYGRLYTIQDDKNPTIETALDISIYLMYKQVSTYSNETISIDGVNVKVFRVGITLMEKLLALHNWYISVKTHITKVKGISPETMRKMRHLQDIYELISKEIIVLDDLFAKQSQTFLNVSLKNEIQYLNFKQCNTLDEIFPFTDQFWADIEPLYNSWDGDKYYNDGTKPDLKLIKVHFDCLKILFSEIVVNNSMSFK